MAYRWSLIAGRLPGRTDNEIKNYWNTHIRRKLLNRGIDPVTHRSLNEMAVPILPDANATTVSFTSSKEQEEVMKSDDGNDDNNGSIDGSSCQDRCPDLNLELRISPPSQCQTDKLPKIVGEKNFYFDCMLGLENGREYSCCGVGSGGTPGGSVAGYDFLGLKTGVSDH